MEWSLLGTQAGATIRCSHQLERGAAWQKTQPSPQQRQLWGSFPALGAWPTPAIPDPSLPPWARCVRVCMHAESLQSRPALCDPMDCSLPGSSAHGLLQARTLEWVAMPSSRGSPRPRDHQPANMPRRFQKRFQREAPAPWGLWAL